MTSFRLATHCILFLSCSLSVLAQDFLSAKILTPSQLPTDTGILAAADLNGDGVTDLVYSTGGASFSVSFGGPSGFQAGGTYPQALSVVTIADINGDGKPDLVSAGGLGPNAVLFTYLNKGDGTFISPTTTAVATNTYIASIGVGDFDGDGKADVVVTTGYEGNFFFLHGNGDGTFGTPKGFSGRFYNAYQVTNAIDLNGDGKLDLVVSVIGASMVEVLLGNGNGTFQAEQAIPGEYNYSPFVADFNGDGIPDIATVAITAINGDYVSTSGNIYAGNGDGTFRLINSVSYSSMPGSLLGVRDVNGDGKLDLVFEDPNGFTVCFGSGGAQFDPPVTYSVERWMSAGSAIGDFNGDGLLDIITSFNYPGTSQAVYLLKGFPGGTFEAAGAVDVESMPSTVATSDLNHDGFPDLVASTQSGTWIYLSSSNGSYSSTSDSFILGDQIFLADLDGDGNADALYVPSFAYSNTSFRHGNGDGTFADPVPGLSLYHGATGVTLGDLNGDGQPDLVGIMDTALYVWLGQGSGNFGAGVYYSSGSYGGRTIIADVNNDGVKDVVAMQPPNVTVLLGAGDGQGTLEPPLGAYPGSDFALADVNGDGKLDLLTISPDMNKVGVDIYLGDGTGSFGAPTFVSTSQAYSSIATGDLNLDGNPDLILLAEPAVGVLYGDGKGGFGPEHVFPVEDGPHSPIVADWNHDGAPDIAVANSGGLGTPSPQAVSFLLNRTGESATLTLSSNPAQYGQPLNLNAAIVPTVPGSATPGGSVSLSVGAIQLQGTLTNGSYSAPLTNLAVGSYSVSGSYTGDGTYRPTTLPASTLSVVKANTTTSISPSASPLTFGTALNCTVIVSPTFSGVPTGTVSLFDGVNLLGTMPLGTAGSANFVLSSLSQGNHTLSAKYSGDGNFIGSTSALTEQVLYPTTVSLTGNASSVLIGSKITLTANVASAYGTPTGTVVFSEGGTILDQAVLAGVTASFSSSTLSQGIHSIQASYQGDGTFVMGKSSALSEAITDFSLSASSQSLTLTAGASGTITLQLSPLSGFSGSVGLACAGAPALATCDASPTSVQVSSGSSSATLTVTTAGTSAALHRDHDVQTRAVLNATAMTFLLSFVGLFAGTTTTRRRAAIALFALLLMFGMSACGGGSSTQATAPQTPSGIRTLTITATTAANGVTVNHLLKLTLIVK